MGIGFRWGMLGLIAAAILALDFIFIPLHSGDDEDHFAAAYSFSHMHAGPAAPPDPSLSSGGYVDAAIQQAVARTFWVVRLRDHPATPGHISWTGRQVFQPMPGTVYLPLIYAPQAAAIRLGEAAGWTVEATINAARIANGLAALGLVALAVINLPGGLAAFLLVLLSLPKTLTLFASNSADPIILGVTACLVAFVVRAAASDWRPRAWHFAIAATGVVILGGVRPPLAALGLLLGYVAVRKRSTPGLLLAVLSVLIPAIWWASVLPQFHDARCPTNGGMAQTIGFFAQQGPALLVRTLEERGGYYLLTFIGELGYGDARVGHLVALPAWIYPAALVMLALGVASGSRRPASPRVDAMALTGVGAVIAAGIFFSLAMACTGAGAAIVGGVQGRYLVVPVLLAVIGLGALLPRFDAAAKLLRIALPVFAATSAGLLIFEGFQLYW